MPTPKKTSNDQPQPRRERESNRDRERERAEERPHKRGDYVAGANGESDVDASAADETEEEPPEKEGTGW